MEFNFMQQRLCDLTSENNPLPLKKTCVNSALKFCHCDGVVGGFSLCFEHPPAQHLHPLWLIHHVNRSAGWPVFALRGEPPMRARQEGERENIYQTTSFYQCTEQIRRPRIQRLREQALGKSNKCRNLSKQE